MASTPIACPRETTDKRRTTTTNSSSSHYHDSAPSRPHSLICTGAEPIHPVHASSQLCRAAVAPRNEVIFLPFWRGFYIVTNLQQYWNVLVKLDSTKASYILVLCMTRFGYFCSHQLNEHILEDIQEREDVGNTIFFVTSKLCCRKLSLK